MGKERCLRALIPLVVSLAASVTTTAAASADSEPMGTVRHAINEDKVGWKNWLAQHFKPPQKGQQAPQNQVSQNHCDGYGRQPSRAVNLRMMKETDIQRIKTSEIQKDKFVVTFPSLYYQWYINRFGKYCWVAEEASTSRMVGYMLGKSEGIPLRGHVSAIAVHPDFRGQGIARRMMKMLEHAADREKCQFVDLFVDPRNTNALEMYEHLGYRVYRKVEDYYQDGHPALDMHKAMSADKTRQSEKRGDDTHVRFLNRWNVF